MVNGTQIVFKNFPVGPLEGAPEKYLDKIGAYVKRQSPGIHRDEGGRKLGYMYISEQPSAYATKSVITALPVPTNTGATVAYPSGNLTAAVISAAPR